MKQMAPVAAGWPTPKHVYGVRSGRLRITRGRLFHSTSNVDAESENDIMKAIHSLAGKKTVILISHRLANVVDSDCIYVLDKGRIAERGTHAELLKKQGAYSRLYTTQKQLETLETEDA